MPRKSDWRDMIPVAGEAEAALKIKGRVGGKGGRMTFRRRSRGRAGPGKTTQWSLLEAPHINSTETDGLRTVWPLTVQGPSQLAPGGIGRLAWFNPQTPNEVNGDTAIATTENYSARLLRFIFQISLYTIVTRYGNTGAANIATVSAVRGVNPYYAVNSVTPTAAAVLEGGITNTFDDATMSHLEGVPLTWYLLYETAAEASQLLTANFSVNSPTDYVKNRRVFAMGGLLVNLANPRTLKFDKKFRALPLTSGDRETWQVTLAMAMPDFTADGEPPMVGSFIHEARASYLKP